MSEISETASPQALATKIATEIRSLPVQNMSSIRSARRAYSRKLRAADAAYVLDLARELLVSYDPCWVAYELIREHPAAFASLGEVELVELGQGLYNWWTVDAFGRILSGPAWLRGQVEDRLIQAWAASTNRWWRRAALVSTVALNMRSQGGLGDTPRTLAVCRLLADDYEDMVIKALSWALRALVPHDPEAVRAFLEDYDGVLAPRVKREVSNKLETGLKNP